MSPASRSALFSLKPTIGTVTMERTLGVSQSFDTLGGMTRSVADLAALTEIILDPIARQRLPKDGYQSFLTRSWKGVRIGFLDPLIWKLPDALCAPNENALGQMVFL